MRDDRDAYRQRNIFLYPPQNNKKKCSKKSSKSKKGSQAGLDEDVIGAGECGKNGNTKIFEADQAGADENGSIEGPYGPFETKTDLIGDGSALLYQVTLPALGGALFQSQLTTLTDGGQRRVRTAQGFDLGTGLPQYVSFYRERKVTNEEFYEALADTIEEYNILESDVCAWQNGPTGATEPTEYSDNPGIEACKTHLEESFECFFGECAA
jgi:hypothetical protein